MTVRVLLLALLLPPLVAACGDDEEGTRFARIDHDTIPAPVAPTPAPQSEHRATVMQEERKQIDAWLRLNQGTLNPMGDSVEAMYAAVPEPFRSRGDEVIDRYEYIALRHSDRPWLKLNAEATRKALAIPDTAGRAERDARLAKERKKKGGKDPWEERSPRRAKKRTSTAPTAPKPAGQ